jgi:hypothetical protein
MSRLKDVQLKLSADDVQEVLSIALDEDQGKALAFIQDRLAKKVEKALQEQ